MQQAQSAADAVVQQAEAENAQAATAAENDLKGELTATEQAAAQQGSQLSGKVDDIVTQSENTDHDAQAVVNDVGAESAAENAEVNAAVNSAKDETDRAVSAVTQFETDADSEIDGVANGLAATTDDDSVKNAAEAGQNEAGAVTKTLNNEIQALMQEFQARLGALMDNATATAEATEASTEAEFSVVDNGIKNVETKEQNQEENLEYAESQLLQMAKTLDAHRSHFETFVEEQLSGFSKRVTAEKEELTTARDYLERYARYTHGRELDLIGATVQYVTSTASHADDVFDELEKEEMELTNSLSGLMKSSQFESLSKVMEASEYVEKVTMDNADVVSYLQEAEPNSIQWMNTVLQALEQAHDLMVAQQAKNAAE